ncbi:MAG: PP2C family serine/threonine-protein phosphatase [Xenococcus sp. (in: cyanobacteria)]
MPHSKPGVQCSNPHCMALNNLESRFCRRCKTPVVKRYLWAMGAKSNLSPETNSTESYQIKPEQVGSLIGERYLALTQKIFLDTKPGLIPQVPEEIPQEITTYLQLFSYSPHIPQVYGQLDGYNIWLLDYGTVPHNSLGELEYPQQLVPELLSFWSEAQAIKQLNWLRQIAGLWRPLLEKKVVSTILNPFFIRVNGSLIQLIELETDKKNQPTLQDLGKLWSKLAKQVSPTIKQMLEQLSIRLENGSISKIEQVLAVLDYALNLCSQNYDYSYQVFACSDSGPTRPNNEDAAYPEDSTPIVIDNQDISLAIVCDGVGGHEGGEIAAKETINYLRSKITSISFKQEHLSPGTIFKQLVKFTNDANDAICKRNDNEQRHERQRMGTTLVMSLTRNHEAYLNSVGDSRIYLVTSVGCHQVTIDDDLASREVRLGYALYRDALQYPSAGALIQALGMRPSSGLHPNVKRLIIDDNCIFLLCTDGLSDFDRVEQYWYNTVLPMLSGKINITKAVKTLVKIANERNGHDNATVALVHCQVKPKSLTSNTSISWSKVETAIADSLVWSDVYSQILPLPDTEYSEKEANLPRTEEILTTHRSKKPLFLLSIVVSLILLVGLAFIIYFFYLESKLNDQDDSLSNPEAEQIIPEN